VLIYVLQNLGWGTSLGDACFHNAITQVRRNAALKLVTLYWERPEWPGLRQELMKKEDTKRLVQEVEAAFVLPGLARASPELLRAKLKDDNPALRSLVVQTICRRRLPLEEDLIGLLEDKDAEVQQAAHQGLVLLGRGTDFGPPATAGKAERARAVERWTTWLALQQAAPPEGEQAAPPEGAVAAELSDQLVQARGERQQELLARLRDGDGEQHTAALARAIPHLSGDVRDQARAALTGRLTRLSASDLRGRLQDEDPEVRRAAARACALARHKDLLPDLRSLLKDADAAVAGAARAALDEMGSAGP
jgi:hypothetical protein